MNRKTLAAFLVTVLLLVTVSSAFAETAELTFWDMKWGGDNYVATAQSMVDQFNAENPDIHVTYQSIVWDNYYQTFLTAVTGGAAPDVSTGAFPQAVQYAQMGEILDLTADPGRLEREQRPDPFGFHIGCDYHDGILRRHALRPALETPTRARYGIIRKRLKKPASPNCPRRGMSLKRAVSRSYRIRIISPSRSGAGDHMATQFAIGLFIMNGIGFSNEAGDGAFTDIDKAVECLSFLGNLYDKGYVTAGYRGLHERYVKPAVL